MIETNEYIFFLNDNESDDEFYNKLSKEIYQYYYNIQLDDNQHVKVINGNYNDLTLNNLILVK